MLDTKKIFPNTIFQVLLFLLLSFLCIVGVFYFDSILLVDFPLDQRMTFETFFFLFIPIILFFIINRNRKNKIIINSSEPDLRLLFSGIFVVCSIVVIIYFYNNYEANSIRNNPYNLSNIWMLLSTCLIAPILEEIYFRIIIQNGLNQSYQPKVSILLTAIIFMLVHSPSQYPLAFVMGMFIGFAYQVTKFNILVAIFLHVLANNFSTFLQFLAFKYGEFSLAMLIISLFSFGIFLYLFIKNVKNNQNIYYRS